MADITLSAKGRAELVLNDVLVGTYHVGLFRYIGAVAGDTCTVQENGVTIWKGIYGGPGLPDVMVWPNRAALTNITVTQISGGRVEVYAEVELG